MSRRTVLAQAMPPTFETDFSYKLPVNNKWVVPQRVLERNAQSIINAPEFDLDFSVSALPDRMDDI